jgi:hypothetical protein
MSTKVSRYGKQVIIRTSSLNWADDRKIMESNFFREMLSNYISELKETNSDFMQLFPNKTREKQVKLVLTLLKALHRAPAEKVRASNPELESFFSNTYLLDQFVEEFYNFWRRFERYLICESCSDEPATNNIDKKPYRIFNNTIESLNDNVRKIYRDIRENITGEHPNIFRQVPAGCPVGAIATTKSTPIPEKYSALKDIPVIRQVLIEPPLIIDPPNNKRKGIFKLVSENPLKGVRFRKEDWLCFPAKVGELVVYLYFHNFYMGLGISTANLFELCTEKDLSRKPDAIYAFGVPEKAVEKFAPDKTVYYHDKENEMMVAVIPKADEFGYFGYVKKVMLTLHNSIMIKRGRLPVHGAMTEITMKNGTSANVVIFGDTGTGKSESLEAFRVLSKDNLKDMKVIFDDMGSLELKGREVLAFGTETGAFVRLDDLQAGYAFGNIDRSIIHSPQKINARAVLPITTLQEILRGHRIDYFLYANNYEEVTDGKFLKKFPSPEEAMKVFSEAKRMAKGTTDETGLVSAYYANFFGPIQFKEEHEPIAKKMFEAMFKAGTYIGQINTQLGIRGMETKGPQLAAKALFGKILKGK